MPFSRETRRKLAALRPSDDLGGDAPQPSAAADDSGTTSPTPSGASLPAPQPGTLGALPPRTRDRLRARLSAQQARRPSPVAHSFSSVTREAAPMASPEGVETALEELFPGEVCSTPSGVCYVMRPLIEQACEWAESVAGRFRHSPVERSRLGERAAFLDIETTGLSRLPVFLVGILYVYAGELSLVQILARDYPEEAPLLHHTVEALRGAHGLFTYNGAGFDLPYLSDRAIYHAVEFGLEAEHTDLLPLARRRFRGAFSDCSLQTLERHVCGRERGDDIPASQIPQRYRDFVCSRDARLLESIIRHNRLDLLSLAELLPHCLTENPD